MCEATLIEIGQVRLFTATLALIPSLFSCNIEYSFLHYFYSGLASNAYLSNLVVLDTRDEENLFSLARTSFYPFELNVKGCILTEKLVDSITS